MSQAAVRGLTRDDIYAAIGEMLKALRRERGAKPVFGFLGYTPVRGTPSFYAYYYKRAKGTAAPYARVLLNDPVYHKSYGQGRVCCAAGGTKACPQVRVEWDSCEKAKPCVTTLRLLCDP